MDQKDNSPENITDPPIHNGYDESKSEKINLKKESSGVLDSLTRPGAEGATVLFHEIRITD